MYCTKNIIHVPVKMVRYMLKKRAAQRIGIVDQASTYQHDNFSKRSALKKLIYLYFKCGVSRDFRAIFW